LEVIFKAFKCEGEIVINFLPPDGWANKTGQSSLGAMFMVHNQLSSRQLVRTFGHGRICLQHNAFINLTTFFSANHGLHLKFDIQGVHKIMNPTTKDQATWLVDVRA
jgi:hypothetical protein